VFSADGQRILSWSEDGTVRLWSGADGQPVGAPMKHEGLSKCAVLGAVFSADGQRILSWSEDGTARLWSGENSQLMALFRHGDAVNSACFDKQEQRILTASKDGSVGLWDISFDASIPIEERLVEFEVRSATTLAPNAEVRVLTESEWAARKQRLAELRRKRGAN
jgi:WD40 repeat protein